MEYTDVGDTSQVWRYRNDTITRRKIYLNKRVWLDEELRGADRHGVMKIFFDNGTLKSLQTFREGVEDGPFLTYFRNGNLKSKGFTQNNVAVGEFVQYYENGNVFIQSDSLGNGRHRLYEKDGNLKYVILYDNFMIMDTLYHAKRDHTSSASPED